MKNLLLIVLVSLLAAVSGLFYYNYVSQNGSFENPENGVLEGQMTGEILEDQITGELITGGVEVVEIVAQNADLSEVTFGNIRTADPAFANVLNTLKQGASQELLNKKFDLSLKGNCVANTYEEAKKYDPNIAGSFYRYEVTEQDKRDANLLCLIISDAKDSELKGIPKNLPGIYQLFQIAQDNMHTKEAYLAAVSYIHFPAYQRLSRVESDAKVEVYMDGQLMRKSGKDCDVSQTQGGCDVSAGEIQEGINAVISNTKINLLYSEVYGNNAGQVKTQNGILVVSYGGQAYYDFALIHINVNELTKTLRIDIKNYDEAVILRDTGIDENEVDIIKSFGNGPYRMIFAETLEPLENGDYKLGDYVVINYNETDDGFGPIFQDVLDGKDSYPYLEERIDEFLKEVNSYLE